MRNIKFVLTIIMIVIFIFSCKEDKEIIEIESVKYSTIEYVVLEGESGKSVKAQIMPETASVNYKIKSITKDDQEFLNDKDDFIVEESGIIKAASDNELKEGVYKIIVEAINSADESNKLEFELIFKIVKLRDLESLTYAQEKYIVANSEELIINAPVIVPQGIEVQNTIKLFKEGIKLDADDISIENNGKITLNQGNNLENGDYTIEVTSTNVYDSEDYVIKNVPFVIYSKVESITYAQTEITVKSNAELSTQVPTITDEKAKVSYSIISAKKDTKDFTFNNSHFYTDNKTGSLNIVKHNNLEPATYEITIEAQNTIDPENKVTAKIILNVLEDDGEETPDFYYEIKPYYIDKGEALITDAPIHKETGDYSYSIVKVSSIETTGTPIATDEITIDEQGRLKVPAVNTLNYKYYRVDVLATKGTQSYQTKVYLLTNESSVGMFNYFGKDQMGAVKLITGKEYIFKDPIYEPNNMPDIRFEFNLSQTEIGDGYSDWKKFNPADYGITLDEKTGKIIIPAGNNLPDKYVSNKPEIGTVRPQLRLTVRLIFNKTNYIDSGGTIFEIYPEE